MGMAVDSITVQSDTFHVINKIKNTKNISRIKH